MRLLMVTRKVDKNDHLAGFIYQWVKKIGQNCDELRVISWQEGDSSDLPKNIRVFHLKTKQNKIVKIIHFSALIIINILKVDGIFCHQMPLYTILSAPWAKIFGKRIICWYTHKHIDFKMKLMEKLADVVLTASKESFRLPSKKVCVVGHGIDTDIFSPAPQSENSTKINLLTVGRISPSKNYELIISAAQQILQNSKKVSLIIVGDPAIAEQKSYYENLKSIAANFNPENSIRFLKAIPNINLPSCLRNADIFINMSNTGSLDKAVLEAMACGTIVITSNEAFFSWLPPECFIKNATSQSLAKAINNLIEAPEEYKNTLRHKLREIVVENHNLDNLAKKIVTFFIKNS